MTHHPRNRSTGAVAAPPATLANLDAPPAQAHGEIPSRSSLDGRVHAPPTRIVQADARCDRPAPHDRDRVQAVPHVLWWGFGFALLTVVALAVAT